MTNWYSVFYWLTVADRAKQILGVVTIIAVIITCVSLIGLFVSSSYKSDNDERDESYKEVGWDVWVKAYRTAFLSFFILAFICGTLNIFIPTKKDALIIIAGGAVGNFITQDTSARKIPSEVMLLLRTKIAEEIKETTLKDAIGITADTLKSKTKEELILLLEKKEKEKK